MKNDYLTLALPKGRIQDQTLELLSKRGIPVTFGKRSLVAHNDTARIKVILVKNSDLPTYVLHGIAGTGICGDDVLSENGSHLYRLSTLPFGETKMCIASKPSEPSIDDAAAQHGRVSIATKFPSYTRSVFHARGIPLELIKLNGSVELAPILGLAPYIVDLVETGNTLRANNLVVREEIESIRVRFVANPAYFKIHHKRARELADKLQ